MRSCGRSDKQSERDVSAREEGGKAIAPPHFATSLMETRLCANPIFIIGSPRSGTTALGRALARHSQLWTSEESKILVDLFGEGQLHRHFRRIGTQEGCWLHKHGIEKKEFLEFIGLGFDRLFTKISGGKRWVDHTPRHSLLVNELAPMFPGALFIHILRDGRRVVHSMINYKRIQTPWSTDFRKACRTWRHFVSCAIDAELNYPSRFIRVSNEGLIRDAESSFEKIFGFIGVAFEHAPVQFMKSNRINSSVMPNEQTCNLQLSEPWLSWSEEQHEIFREEAWEMLVECGYVGRVGHNVL